MNLKRLTKFVSKGYNRNPKTLYDQIRVRWIPQISLTGDRSYNAVLEVFNERAGKWTPAKAVVIDPYTMKHETGFY